MIQINQNDNNNYHNYNDEHRNNQNHRQHGPDNKNHHYRYDTVNWNVFKFKMVIKDNVKDGNHSTLFFSGNDIVSIQKLFT